MISGPKQPASLSVIVTTYQRPHNLRCVLNSLALQACHCPQLEIVVSDDGSLDETMSVVDQFRAASGLPVRWVTHRHDGFQAAKCRNQGVAASSGDYLIFLDGDCVVGKRFLQVFLEEMRPREVLAGDVYCLTETQTAGFFASPDEHALAGLQPVDDEIRRVRKRHTKFARAEFARRFVRPRNLVKPALKSGVFGIWRSDYYRVNGFDQNYVGWGCEDDDLGLRLRMSGTSIRSVIPQLDVYHLWHPRGETVPDKWKEGANADYFSRRGRLATCLNGIKCRPVDDLQLVIRGAPAESSPAYEFLSSIAHPTDRAEVEAVFWPGNGRFRGSDCRLLIAPSTAPIPRRLQQRADRIVTDQELTIGKGQQQFAGNDLHGALQSIT